MQLTRNIYTAKVMNSQWNLLAKNNRQPKRLQYLEAFAKSRLLDI